MHPLSVFAVGVELAHFLDDLSLVIMGVGGTLEKSVLLTALGTIINSVTFVKHGFFSSIGHFWTNNSQSIANLGG